MIIILPLPVSVNENPVAKEEMKSKVSGIYTFYENYDASYRLKITSDKVIKKWVLIDEESEYDIGAWNPNEGSIKVNYLGTIIVTNKGNLELSGDTYKKGGSWETSGYASSNNDSDDSSSFRFEDITFDSRIIDLKITNTSDYSNNNL